jgi:hypothetical protein
MPVEQPDANPRLEPRNGSADPRWRQSDGVRRTGEAAVFYDGGHHAHTGEQARVERHG